MANQSNKGGKGGERERVKEGDRMEEKQREGEGKSWREEKQK